MSNNRLGPRTPRTKPSSAPEIAAQKSAQPRKPKYLCQKRGNGRLYNFFRCPRTKRYIALVHDLPFDHPNVMASYKDALDLAMTPLVVVAPLKRDDPSRIRAPARGSATPPVNLDDSFAGMAPEARARFVAKFWGKVVRDWSGCWLWTAGKNGKGYGLVRLPARSTVPAHRVSFALTFGDPGDRLVCHECHNPSCVNPFHLYAGNERTNWEDNVARLVQTGQSAPAAVPKPKRKRP